MNLYTDAAGRPNLLYTLTLAQAATDPTRFRGLLHYLLTARAQRP